MGPGAGICVELSLFLAIPHVAWALAAEMSPALEENGVTTADVARVSAQVERCPCVLLRVEYQAGAHMVGLEWSAQCGPWHPCV